MRGLYTEKVISDKIPFGQLVREILDGYDGKFASGQVRENARASDADDPEADRPGVLAERFCDDGEGEINRYNVYKITAENACYVLKRINKRAECLKGEPALKRAYDRFLERQLSCPRTLSNGDFLPFNAIFRDGKVTLVDWAFGGIMPYSLDIARMIAHGTDDRRTFPFYMTEAHKGLFVRRAYELLENKPSYDRYLADIRLAVLNEYIEFIESDLLDASRARDEVFDYYYSEARKLAEE